MNFWKRAKKPKTEKNTIKQKLISPRTLDVLFHLFFYMKKRPENNRKNRQTGFIIHNKCCWFAGLVWFLQKKVLNNKNNKRHKMPPRNINIQPQKVVFIIESFFSFCQENKKNKQKKHLLIWQLGVLAKIIKKSL